MQVVIEDVLISEIDGDILFITHPNNNYVEVEIDSSMFINYSPFCIDFICFSSTFKAA